MIISFELDIFNAFLDKSFASFLDTLSNIDFTLSKLLALIEKVSIFICFACLPEANLEIINIVETYCQQNPWSSDLVRLSLLMGMGEVEIAEILDIPERSVRRQIAALPIIAASTATVKATQQA